MVQALLKGPPAIRKKYIILVIRVINVKVYLRQKKVLKHVFVYFIKSLDIGLRNTKQLIT